MMITGQPVREDLTGLMGLTGLTGFSVLPEYRISETR